MAVGCGGLRDMVCWARAAIREGPGPGPMGGVGVVIALCACRGRSAALPTEALVTEAPSVGRRSCSMGRSSPPPGGTTCRCGCAVAACVRVVVSDRAFTAGALTGMPLARRTAEVRWWSCKQVRVHPQHNENVRMLHKCHDDRSNHRHMGRKAALRS